MVNVYAGKVLRVNLSTGSVVKEDLPMDKAKAFLGGRGLGGKMLTEEIPAGIDPLGEENKVFFITGSLTGTPAVTSGRYMVVTKSPLNNVIASSNSGGYWGAELKIAGYHMVIVEGKSETPVYLYINDGDVEIRPADKYWGMTSVAVDNGLKEEVGDPKARVLNIGPAGENLSPIAAVMNDKWRAAGRSGVGAVMGSKKLKAIVVRGSGKVEAAQPDKFKEVVREKLKKIKENGVTGEGLPKYGTAILVNIINELGVYPTNNFQLGVFPGAEETSGETLAEKYLKKKDGCYRCPIVCGRYCEVDGVGGGGPEYETIWALGADCGISDLKEIIRANNMCNEMGLDTISAGATIAAAMELYEKGYIKPEEVDGPELKFGNAETLVKWLEKMGRAEGLGAKFAQGSARLCEMYGAPELSMSVKKLELPAYDPRGIMGHGLQYATANRGGCHVRGYMISPEVLGLPEKLDRFTLEGKARWVKYYQDLTGVIDSLGLCLFTSFALNEHDYADMYNAATGENLTAEELMACGERINNLERLFNLQEGYTAKDDTLPKSLLEEPMPEGPSKGLGHPLEKLLPEYYELRGGTKKVSLPPTRNRNWGYKKLLKRGCPKETEGQPL